MAPRDDRPEEKPRRKIGGWPLTAAIVVVLVFLFFIRHILLPFILAAALAFLLTPLIEALRARGRMPRWAAASLVYVATLALFGLLFYVVGGPLIRDVTQLVQTVPQNIRKLIGDLAGLAQGVIGHPIDVAALTGAVFAEMQRLVGSGMIASFAAAGVATLFGTILFVFLLIYFLVSGPGLVRSTLWLVPPEYRGEVDRVRGRVQPLLWRYFFGLAIVVTYTSTVAWIGFAWVFHLPHAPLLAIVVGLLELVPLIGPAASIGIIALTALQQAGLMGVLGLVGFALALRLSIDQLIGPLVLGEAARLHPVVIIFCFLSGAVLFGIIGLLLAVPVAASLKIILKIYYAEPVIDAPSTPEKRQG